MSIFNAFRAPSQAANAWFSAGLASSFPNITTSSSTSLSDLIPCKDDSFIPGCKVFSVPPDDSSNATEVHLDEINASTDLKEQVVVFQFQGQFHAIDHICPHSSYPLSNGIPFDIEDFGIRLSAGIRCSKHDWSFDLIRGVGDRGNYRLKVWEVQLRPVAKGGAAESGVEEEAEVWVRRKQRIG